MALLVKVGADLKGFNRAMKRATKDVSYLGTQIAGAGKIMTRGVTLPLIGIAVAAGKVGIDFEAQMNRVAAISGATGKELQALKDKAREMGATTMFSATQSAEGLENFARAGFSVTESLDAIEPSLNLAIATGTELSTVTDIVASAIRGFGMEAKDTAKLTDLLASTAANSNTGLEALGEAFNYVAPIAAALGYTVEDTAEMLGHMANAGIKGSMAGTTLRTAMTNLANPTSAAKKAMKALGIEVADAEGNMLPLDDVVGDLRKSFKDLSQEEQAQAAAALFGKRAMSGMLAVINATDDDIAKLSDATSDYNGVVKEQADIMQSGSKGGLMKLKSAMQELGISMSEVLLPAFNKLIEKVQGLVSKLNSLSPKQKEQIVKFMGIAAAIGPLLVVFGKGIAIFSKFGALLTPITTGSSLLGTAIGSIGLPIIAIIAVVAALIAIFVHLYKNNEAFRDKVNEIWGQIQVMFSAAFEFIKVLFDTFAKLFTAIWENNFMNIQGKVKAGWEFITAIFQTAMAIITDIFKMFTCLLQGDWQGFAEALESFTQNLWGGLAKIFKTGINFVLSYFGTSLDEMVTKVKDKIDQIKAVFEGLKNKIKAIIDKIVNIWKSFKLPKFELKMAVKTILGKDYRYPTGLDVSWHAQGGIFTRPTILGGHGFGDNAGGKEAILPLNRLPQLLGIGGGGDIIVQVTLDGRVIMEYADKQFGKRLPG